jgi:hypothetical protein
MQERPFQFIRHVIDPSTNPATWWKPFIPTPPYSDFPANHATFAGAFTHALTTLFGSNVHFTNSTYKGHQATIDGNIVDLAVTIITLFVTSRMTLLFPGFTAAFIPAMR